MSQLSQLSRIIAGRLDDTFEVCDPRNWEPVHPDDVAMVVEEVLREEQRGNIRGNFLVFESPDDIGAICRRDVYDFQECRYPEDDNYGEWAELFADTPHASDCPYRNKGECNCHKRFIQC